MTKRLLALLEVLMAISIVCTGYASWSFAARASHYAENGAFTAYTVGPNTTPTTLNPAYLGIEMTNIIEGVGASQTFRYKTVTVGGTPTEEFASTSLSILFKVDIDKMEGSDADYREEVLLVTCAAKDGTTTRYWKDGGDGDVDYWLTYSSAILYVDGYPNVSLAVDVDVYYPESISDPNYGALKMEIPLTELYNLLLPCKKGAITDGETKYLPVELVLDFTPTGAGNSDTESENYDTQSITVPCGYQYTFSAQLTPKT